jgi:hypothetical protein
MLSEGLKAFKSIKNIKRDFLFKKSKAEAKKQEHF